MDKKITIKDLIMGFIKTHKLFIFILTAIIIWLTFSINFSVLSVVGESMEPTLNNGQLLFSHKSFMTFNRFDIIVYLDDTQKPVIKRIIGLPGETVEYKDNFLYIDGNLIDETYSIGETEDFSVQLGIDNYYCLGDNREHSRDSRAIGQIPKENIIAKVIL